MDFQELYGDQSTEDPDLAFQGTAQKTINLCPSLEKPWMKEKLTRTAYCEAKRTAENCWASLREEWQLRGLRAFQPQVLETLRHASRCQDSNTHPGEKGDENINSTWYLHIKI